MKAKRGWEMKGVMKGVDSSKKDELKIEECKNQYPIYDRNG